MTAAFSLSRVLNILLISVFGQFMNLSDSLRSREGACLSISREDVCPVLHHLFNVFAAYEDSLQVIIC